jgi:hypothetical protein
VAYCMGYKVAVISYCGSYFGSDFDLFHPDEPDSDFSARCDYR